jgi:hypothetical protein
VRRTPALDLQGEVGDDGTLDQQQDPGEQKIQSSQAQGHASSRHDRLDGCFESSLRRICDALSWFREGVYDGQGRRRGDDSEQREDRRE